MVWRYPKQRARLSANELNRTSAAVQRVERSQLGTKDLGSVREHLTWWCSVKNNTGADRKRFETVALADPIFPSELDGSVDLLFSAIASDPDKTPAILIDDIADGEFGRAVCYGLAEALVDGGDITFKYAKPTTSNTLEPAKSGPFKLLKAPDASSQKLLPVLWVGAPSGARDITYTIDSIAVASSGPYTGLTIATVTIQGTTPSIPELIGTSQEVVDHSGCVFDIAEADLVDVFGWATERVYKSLEAGHTDELTDPHWDADDRCCVGS